MLSFCRNSLNSKSVMVELLKLTAYGIVFCTVATLLGDSVASLENFINFFDETFFTLACMFIIFSTIPVNLSLFFNFIYKIFSRKTISDSSSFIDYSPIIFILMSNSVLFLISFLKINKVLSIDLLGYVNVLLANKSVLSVEIVSYIFKYFTSEENICGQGKNRVVTGGDFYAGVSEAVLSELNSFFFFDGFSLWLVWLLLIVVSVLSVSGIQKSSTFLKFLLFEVDTLSFILLATLICFISKDIFIFFSSFEAILMPLVFFTIFRGSRLNKIFAVKYLVVYTLVGSIFLWFSVSYLFSVVGSSNYDMIRFSLTNSEHTGERFVLFFSLFLGFAFKVPVVPFHHWLIVAHVEAPTAGSIVLAALLLKVGTYGIYRFVFLLFPVESFYFSSEVLAVSLLGFTYATLSAVRQIDIKRYVAYTSIAHMNFSLIGLFSNSEFGILGYLHTTISHGIIATAMFFLIGEFYGQLHFRDVLRARGISQLYPNFSIFFFLFSMANSGLPLFSGFVGEYLILLSVSATNEFFAVLIFLGFMVTGIYNISFITNFLFGDSNMQTDRSNYSDLNSNSIVVLSMLLFWTVVLGLFPDILLKTVDAF